jgi:CRISPR/Cas system type I-B associated protein Csh2 (Cas7 group RAMP superfamily)
MNGIINDVNSLRKFRNKLLDTVDDLKTQLKTTETAIEDVAHSWGDSQFKKFHEGFDEDKELINPLCKKIEEFEGEVLLPLENILIEYNGL